MASADRKRKQDDLQPERAGRGALLERDYWAVVQRPRVRCDEVGGILAERFEEFPPPGVVRFRRRSPGAPDPERDTGNGGRPRPLRCGDELDVDIAGAGSFAVRIIHLDDRSVTLATLAGHPEAGRITFGAYENDRGDVVFHIRSRARARNLLGFVVAGDGMQTLAWADFVNRFAAIVGDGVVGTIRSEKRRVPEEHGDLMVDRPTYRTRG